MCHLTNKSDLEQIMFLLVHTESSADKLSAHCSTCDHKKVHGTVVAKLLPTKRSTITKN
jgi:hypothetical protein